jgi:diguanylate cyclase (GGDEF)-like protein
MDRAMDNVMGSKAEAAAAPPDLFDAEHRALLAARMAYEQGEQAGAAACHQALGVLLSSYDRLLRETRRLVRRSDRAELEMTQLNQRLQDLAGELEYRATHDPLTGVFNRAAIIEHVNRHFIQQGLALIELDIDHFKRVNDSFGHPVGDSVILGVVRCLKAMVPETAHIGRVGGEEFTVLLPRHDSDGAVQVAEQVRAAIEAHAFGLPDGSCITASFGVSWRPAGGRFDDAYGLADDALYAAKRGGRNQVVRAADHAPA